MRKATFILIAILLGGTLLGTGTTALAQGETRWVGEYFSNATLTGNPALVRADGAINFTWGNDPPAPGLPADRFSVRWTSAQPFAGGTYRFIARSDDGIRVYLDNTLILDAWYDHAPDPPLAVDVNVAAGNHAVRVDYYENAGAALVSVSWALTSVPTTTTWLAEYYNNLTLSGVAARQQVEEVIDYNWGEGSPLPGLVNADNFSVRWTGSPHFVAGTYTFTVNADDGVRMWIDNVLVIDAWVDSGFTPAYTTTLPLSEGQHAIRVEYYERLEVAAIRVNWAASVQPSAAGIWQALYYNGPTPTGTAVYSEQITTEWLDLNWGAGSPAATVNVDNFSGRLTRTADFYGGNARFGLRIDDGFRFYIDGQPMLDEWHESSGDYYFVDFAVTAGSRHTLVLDFYESTDTASVELFWAYPCPALPAGGAVVMASVNTPLLNIRNGPGNGYPIIGRAPDKRAFVLTGRSYTDQWWWRINFGTVQGWVSARYMTLAQGADINQVLVVSPEEATLACGTGSPTGLRIRTTSDLNIRTGPGVSYGIVGLLAEGADADIVGRNADGTWWEINFSRGRGWVSASFVQLEGSTGAAVPVTAR